MTQIRVPYGRGYLTVTLPASRTVEHIVPAQVDPAPDPIALVYQALDNPVGKARLTGFTGSERVVIAINDKTRPVPHAELLPPLLDRLAASSLPDTAITFVIATGTHPPMMRSEHPLILPDDILARYRVVCHDATDEASLVSLGKTSRGTPVHINRHYMEADFRVVVGNIEPHQFMGFSGGAKSAAIGLAGEATIRHNHAMMTAEGARLGHYEDNPARQDVEEIGRLIGIHFALNTVLNTHRRIVQVIAGDPAMIMPIAIPQVRRIFQVPVAAPFDLIITSPGGHPKDINLYQAQKALAHAALVTKDGGTVILVAACPEGAGGKGYEDWMKDASTTSHQAVLHRIEREGFAIGPHKAFLLSRDAIRLRVWLVSEMEPDAVRQLLLHPARDLEDALTSNLADLPPEARIGIMPIANVTIPTR